MDENENPEERGLVPIGSLIQTSSPGRRQSSGFRMIGFTLRPKDFEIIGSLRPGLPRAKSIGALLSEIGFDRTRVNPEDPIELLALNVGITELELSRSQWAWAERVDRDLVESTRNRVFNSLRLLGASLKIADNHDVQVGHRIEAFRTHGFIVDTQDEYHAMAVDDWVYCFMEFPLWAVDWGMKQYLKSETKRAMPASVRRYLPIARFEKAKTNISKIVNNDLFWRGSVEELEAYRD